MSDAQRTDAEWAECSADPASAAMQMRDFARKMERELAVAKKDIDNLCWLVGWLGWELGEDWPREKERFT